MAIVSSMVLASIGETRKQVWIRHTDGDGNNYDVGPLYCDDTFDVNAYLSVSASETQERLAEIEVTRILSEATE